MYKEFFFKEFFTNVLADANWSKDNNVTFTVGPPNAFTFINFLQNTIFMRFEFQTVLWN